MASPLVSIGIPTFNRPESLDRLLNQISKQTYKNFEVVVSDNCSPDPTVYEIAIFHSLRDPRIHVYRQVRSLGIIGNHDFVKNHANGKYFLWLHDDDELPENYLTACMNCFETNPKATLVGPSCDRFLDGVYWYTYKNWSSIGQSTFTRLNSLIASTFTNDHIFEQYMYGIFLRDAAPINMSPEFKCIHHHFFTLSEAGEIAHVSDIKLVKHTTKENLRMYETGGYYRRHKVLSLFPGHGVESLQQCFPITLQVAWIVMKSKNLSLFEKLKLLSKLAKLFFRYPIKHEFSFFRTWLAKVLRRNR